MRWIFILLEKKRIEIPLEEYGAIDSVAVFGSHDRNLRLIEQGFEVKIYISGNSILISGSAQGMNLAKSLLLFLIGSVNPCSEEELKFFIKQMLIDPSFEMGAIDKLSLKVSARGKVIRPRGKTQTSYLNSISKNQVIFGVGPAGTGKTYLAMAYAVNRLFKEKIRKIILVRPVVEAGESLGFLPGDLIQKINPYLIPLYDAIVEMVGPEKFEFYSKNGQIEVAPLAYMRGRTLSNAVIVLDEAQNSTAMQMKMFLTRLGEGSKAIITGDISQIDLLKKVESGLVNAQKVLKNVAGAEFIRFNKEDVVRHKIVQDIVEAYEKYEDVKK